MAYFDASAGLLDRTVFSSAEIYEREIEAIFQSVWLFVGPQDWVAEPGDFYLSSMGSTPVILWRALDSSLKVLVNRCPYGVEAITEEERGRAEVFVCPCHGQPFMDGSGRELDAAPQVATHSGLVFACMSEDGPGLRESMGDFAWYLEIITNRPAGGAQIYGGGPLRWIMRGNWKLAAEAFAGDIYRDTTAHQATREALGAGGSLADRTGFQAATGSGTMVVATDEAHLAALDGPAGGDDPRNEMLPLSATLFPNLSYDGRTETLHVWHPRGPNETEVHTYCLVGRDDSPATKEKLRRRCQRHFGPAGLESGDD